MTSTFIVTIDGPAASGKTSVSRELANRLACHWVSTGAFYRGLAWVANEEGIALNNEAELAELASSDRWRVVMDELETRVFFGSRDVSHDVRQESVGGLASQVSQLPLVRKALLRAQRDCARNVSALVAEGRDCGSVVFPDAQLKVYLTARSELRAERRAKEQGSDVAATLSQTKDRDSRDATRTAAPMQIPQGALVLDTSLLSLREVVEQLEKAVEQIRPRIL
jgi:cytidylate kinase